jgi:DNA-binding XRE family transcriptional regulator
MAVHKDLLGQRVGERLRAVRRNNNLSQNELGKLIGTSTQQILKYEKALDVPSLSRLVQLATALNMPLSFFFEDHYISKDAVATGVGTTRHVLMHAYGMMNQRDRTLLFSIAEALVECSNADRAHRSDETARSDGVLAGGTRGRARNS